MKKAPVKHYLRVLLILAAALFTFCSAYPGFMSKDTMDQYEQALSGVYSDWHPPAMAWLWHQLLPIWKGPQPMLLLNIILYWTAVGMIAFRIRNLGLSIAFILFGFAPPLINFIGVIWKDSLMFALLFFETALMFQLYERTLKSWQKIVAALSLLLLSYCIMLLRHNAGAAVLPVLAIPICLFTRQKGLLRPLLWATPIAIILFFAAGRTNRYLCKGKSMYPEQQLMTYDLMGVAQGSGENPFPQYLKARLPLDSLPKVYSPCDGALYVIFHMGCTTDNPAEINELKKSWKNAILRHPLITLAHKKRAFDCILNESSLTTFPLIQANPYGFSVDSERWPYRQFVHYTESDFAKKLYKALYYLLGCLFVSIVSIVLIYKKQKAALVPVFYISLSGLLYSSAYFFLSPCNDLRYNYWTIGAFLISLFLLMDALIRRK